MGTLKRIMSLVGPKIVTTEAGQVKCLQYGELQTYTKTRAAWPKNWSG